MKKEVEVKVKVDNFDSILLALTKLGIKISEPVLQDDMVFVNYDGPYTDFPEGANYLRIRQTNDKAFFTLKRGEELSSIERETEISNPEHMRDSLLFMGYHEVVRVIKNRRKAIHKDYEICLDQVTDLGSFIEIEKITDEDSKKVQEEMFLFIQELGGKKDDRITNGYDTLMYLKNNK